MNSCVQMVPTVLHVAVDLALLLMELIIQDATVSITNCRKNANLFSY